MNKHEINTSEGEVIICDRCKRKITYPEKFTIIYDYDNGEVKGIYDEDCAATFDADPDANPVDEQEPIYH